LQILDSAVSTIRRFFRDDTKPRIGL
jgi:hypothetical protein